MEMEELNLIAEQGGKKSLRLNAIFCALATLTGFLPNKKVELVELLQAHGIKTATEKELKKWMRNEADLPIDVMNAFFAILFEKKTEDFSYFKVVEPVYIPNEFRENQD